MSLLGLITVGTFTETPRRNDTRNERALFEFASIALIFGDHLRTSGLRQENLHVLGFARNRSVETGPIEVGSGLTQTRLTKKIALA